MTRKLHFIRDFMLSFRYRVSQMCQLQLYSQLRDNGKMNYRFSLHFSEQNRNHPYYIPI